MAFAISSDAVAELRPVALPDDVSLIKHDQGQIIWSTQSDHGAQHDSNIKVEEIVLVAEVSGGCYLILTLSQGEQDGEKPFQLSSFLARSLPQELLGRYLLKETPAALKTGHESSLDVIVSVRSGTGLPQKFYDAVLQPLLNLLGSGEGSYGAIFTKDANTVKEYAQERWGNKGQINPGDTSKKETVILLSGDGGIVDLLNGSTEHPGAEAETLPTIALIPLGTGNALFHSLHKPHYARTDPPAPSPLVLALRALLHGRPAPLPTFQASFSAGSHLVEESSGSSAGIARLTGAIVASYGFHSQLVWESDTPAYRKHGAKRFGMVAQELLKESHAYSATVETSSSSRLDTTRFNYILATMVSNLEKTFTISPHSKPLDGQLRLVYFGDVSGGRTMEIMMAAYDNGSHVGMKWTTEGGGEDGVGYEAVEEVKVTTLEEDARWRKVCIDGTIVEIPQGGSMTVKKSPEAKLQVLVLDA
ncbi:Sphingosine kinase 1 [Cytospora mali]|uniref:Sphingosine kinase 1 n=1 Tax=Cytospora mali TaxID=578113 RepID=A0A194UPZ8_CYTMA|nr:Sphingosine kinase 1 [Valsa mali var. pyri (nom. inval.)]